METECRNGEGPETLGSASTDMGNIVVERKPKARSDKQMEALRAAQAARKLKAEARRTAREEEVVAQPPPPTPSEAVAVSAPPGRDYRGLYKEQKRELELLRFERAVAERLMEVKEREERAVKEETKKEPKKEGVVLFGNQWNTAAVVRKKNVGPSW